MPNKNSYIYQHKRRTIIGLSILLVAMIYFFHDSSFILRAFTTIGFLFFFYATDHIFDIRFKAHHYLIIIVIATASIMLSPLYFLYPQYDKVQHFVNPILTSILIFYAMNTLQLGLKWKITYTFFITAGILGLFEIGEFILDQLFNLQLQGVFLRDISGLNKLHVIQEPLTDTMNDLILGYAGAGLYALTMFFKKRREAFRKR